MMAGMRGRVLAWAGGTVAVAAAAGLGVYFAVAGLDKADKLASVASMYIGLAGLVAAVYGMVRARGDAPGSSSAAVEGDQSIAGSTVAGGVTRPGDGGHFGGGDHLVGVELGRGQRDHASGQRHLAAGRPCRQR